MHLFMVISYCLVGSVFGKHIPDTDPGEDFPLDTSAFGKHIPDADFGGDFPLDFSGLDFSAFDLALQGEDHFDPRRLNSTQKIPGICYVCKKVVRYAIRKMTGNYTKSKINWALHLACRSIGVPAWLCKKFVHTYLGQLIHDILTMQGARTICMALRLCWWPLPEKALQGKPAAKPPRTIHKQLP